VLNCYSWRGKPGDVGLKYRTTMLWSGLLGEGLLYDRLKLFISKDYSNIVVVYYYRASLVSLIICSSLAYIVTSVGNRLTAISTDSDLLTPSSLDSHSKLLTKVSSHLIWNLLDFVMTLSFPICHDRFSLS